MLAGVLTAMLAAAPGQSAPLPEAEQQRFKTLVLSGERFYAEGEPGFAIWAFREADRIRMTPEVAFNLAKVHQNLQDWATASYYYRLYLRRAPEATDALEVAEFLGETLSAAEMEGRGLVEIDAPTSARVTLDGRLWPDVPVAAFLPPGDYTLQVDFENGRQQMKKLSVLTGRTLSLRLEGTEPPLLEADGAASALSVASRTGPGLRPALHYSSMAVLGASALALVAGSVFGVMSNAEAGRLQTQKQSLTVSGAQAVARSAGQKGATANALWLAGGAGLAAGGALFVFTLPEPGGTQ